MRFFMPLIFVLILPAASGLTINEIHPNPVDDCMDCSEWIELSAEDEAGNYTVNVRDYNVTLENPRDGLIILTRNVSVFSDLWGIENATEAKFRLINDGDTIRIFKDSELIESVDYPSFSSRQGESYSRISGDFVFSDPTPMEENFINTLEPETIGEPEESGDECNISIDIGIDKVIEPVKNEYFLVFSDPYCHEKHPVKIQYWIEDLYGHVVKEEVQTEKEMSCDLKISRQWTPPDILGTSGFRIVAEIIDSGCDDVSSGKRKERIVVVKGEKPQESIIDIEKIYLGSDGKVKFGENFGIKIYVYKGDTDKTSLDVWVENDEKISTETHANIYGRYSENSFTLPVQLEANCDNEYKEGEYKLIVEGLGLKAVETIDVEGISADKCRIVKELIEIEQEPKVFIDNISENITEPEDMRNISPKIPTGQVIRKNPLENLIDFLNNLLFGFI